MVFLLCLNYCHSHIFNYHTYYFILDAVLTRQCIYEPLNFSFLLPSGLKNVPCPSWPWQTGLLGFLLHCRPELVAAELVAGRPESLFLHGRAHLQPAGLHLRCLLHGRARLLLHRRVHLQPAGLLGFLLHGRPELVAADARPRTRRATPSPCIVRTLPHLPRMRPEMASPVSRPVRAPAAVTLSPAADTLHARHALAVQCPAPSLYAAAIRTHLCHYGFYRT